MLYTEFNMDEAMSVWREEERIKGREEERKQIALDMMAEGLPEAQIKKILNLSDEKLTEFKKNHAETKH